MQGAWHDVACHSLASGWRSTVSLTEWLQPELHKNSETPRCTARPSNCLMVFLEARGATCFSLMRSRIVLFFCKWLGTSWRGVSGHDGYKTLLLKIIDSHMCLKLIWLVVCCIVGNNHEAWWPAFPSHCSPHAGTTWVHLLRCIYLYSRSPLALSALHNACDSWHRSHSDQVAVSVLFVALSRKLAFASWSPSCFSKVLGGWTSPEST